MRDIGPQVATHARGEFPRVGLPGVDRHSWRVLVLAVLLAVPYSTSSQQQSQGIGGHFPTAPHDLSQDANQLSPFYDQGNSGEAEKRLRMINAERHRRWWPTPTSC
jgi:hypothetical protein